MASSTGVTTENQHSYAIQSGSAAGADPRAGTQGGTQLSPMKRRKLVFSKLLTAQKGWKVPKGPRAASTKALPTDDARLVLFNQRLTAVEGALVSVVALTDQLDGFAGALAADKVRAEELVATLVKKQEKDLMTLETVLQAKLSTIETTFSTCDRALKELQQAAFASAAASPPQAEGPATTILRQRADEMALEQLKHSDKLHNLEEQYIALKLNTQSSVTELTSLMLTAAGPLQQAVREARDREQILDGKLASMWERMETSACRCPEGCPGRTAAGTAAPPSGNTAGPNTSGAAPSSGPPGMPEYHQRPDPWREFRSSRASGKRGGGGDGDGGGDDDDGNGSQVSERRSDHAEGGRNRPRNFVIGSPGSHQGESSSKPLLMDSRSPFDSKDKSDLPRFNGRDKNVLWRKKVTLFLVTKCPDIKPFLKWAEQEREEITPQAMQKAWSSTELRWIRNDPRVLSFHLFGFLITNLDQDAWDIMDGVGDENGLEVWRLVNLNVTQRTQSELLSFQDAVLNPKRLLKLKDIPRGLLVWDNAYRDYVDAGGKPLDDDSKIGCLMRLFPSDLKEKLTWEMEKFGGKPMAMRKWVMDRVKVLIGYEDADSRHAKPAHVLEDDLGVDDKDEAGDFADLEGKSHEELCALLRRPPGKGSGKVSGKNRPAREAPARDARDVRCGNCGGKGHTSQDCREARRGPQQRTCFECGEPGHVAAKCPKRAGARPPSRPEKLQAEPVTRILDCRLLDDAGYTPVHRQRRQGAERLRRRADLSSSQSDPPEANRFAALTNGDASSPGSDSEDTCGGVPGIIDYLADEPAGETPGRTRSKEDHVVGPPSPAVIRDRPTGRPAKKLMSACTYGCAQDCSRKHGKKPIMFSNDPRLASTPTRAQDCPVNMLFDVEDLYALPAAEEPEFLEVECCLDTGSSVHAADRLDLPGYDVTESPGSKAGQKFQAAGGKLIDNEGQVQALMDPPGGQADTSLQVCFQIAKVTRPLLSVTKMTEGGDMHVLCKKDEALVLDIHNRVVARFARKGGLYVALMRVKNPRWKPFQRQAIR